MLIYSLEFFFFVQYLQAICALTTSHNPLKDIPITTATRAPIKLHSCIESSVKHESSLPKHPQPHYKTQQHFGINPHQHNTVFHKRIQTTTTSNSSSRLRGTLKESTASASSSDVCFPVFMVQRCRSFHQKLAYRRIYIISSYQRA